jgi:hypothetical protein
VESPIEIFKKWCNAWKPPLKRYWPIPPDVSKLFYQYHVVADRHIEYLRGHLREGKEIEVHFDFIDNGELNAHASIWPDPRNKLGIVAFHRGAVLLPLDLFQRMLSHPEILPDVGNPKLESSDAQFNDGLCDDIDTLHESRRLAGRPKEPILPRCPIRRQLAIELAGFAFDFLVLHELAHIFCGHIDYMSLVTGKCSIIERTLSATDQYGLPTIKRQAIELAADSTAVGLTIDSLLQGTPVFLNGPPGWEEYFSELDQRIYVWAFAIAGVFRLWGVKIDLDALEDAPYPPTALRFASAFTTAATHIKNVKPDFYKRFNEVVDDALQTCGDAAQLVGGPPIKQEDIRPVYEELGRSHYTKIRQCWENEILPEVQKISYGPMHLKEPA